MKEKYNTGTEFSMIETEFLNPSFEFWFKNHEHIRTPFPQQIKVELMKNTRSIFLDWVSELKPGDKKGLNDEGFTEMFETILFNEAMKLVDNEDQRISIAYPFMPRLGDLVRHRQYGEGKIIERKEIVSDKNKKMLEITVSCTNNPNSWKTQFELSA